MMHLNSKWDLIRKSLGPKDFGFLLLRIVVLVGGFGWLSFSTVSHEVHSVVLKIYYYYLLYNFFIYILVFYRPWAIRKIYFIGLVFDLFFVFLLVKYTGGFNSSFYLGFYLLTALHTFYYGVYYGVSLAVASSLVYLFAGDMDFEVLQWTDYMLRISFLFLIGLPLGRLSGELKRDKKEIEKLNSELKKSLVDLQRTQKRLIENEKLSALGRLTADVAHEIRNPLTSIGGFARRLRKKLPDDSKEGNYAEMIVSETDKLEKMLKDVLIFSREARVHFELVTVEDILEEYLGEAVILKDIAVSIRKEYGAVDLKTFIDKEQLKQVLQNLIINATDAMSGKGAITLKTRKDRMNNVDYVVIDVIDTGKGISEDKLGVIFEPFYSTKEIGVGTGLGLSICKKIMDEHNGLIRVESELSAGSRFSLYFPVQREQLEEDADSVKCWQFMKCGIERTCSTYPNFGRDCWVVAGTFSEKKVQCIYAQKLADCRKCTFYQSVVIEKSL